MNGRLCRNTPFTITSVLGEGAYGKVYEAKNNKTNDKYAVKSTFYEVFAQDASSIFETIPKSGVTYNRLIKLLNNKGYDLDLFETANRQLKNTQARVYPNTKLWISDNFILAYFKDVDVYDRSHKMILATIKNFEIIDDFEAEYIFDIYVTKILHMGLCINFVETFYHFTCFDSQVVKKFNQYVVKEILDENISNTHRIADLHHNREDIEASLAVQIFFAIGCLNYYLGATHNDLHGDNILVKKIDQNMTYNGTKLIDCDYFHYRIFGIDIYIPKAIACIFKISDLGLAIKWVDRPMMAYNTRKFIDELYGNILYDVLRITHNILGRDSFPGISDGSKGGNRSIFYDIFKYFTGVDYVNGQTFDDTNSRRLIEDITSGNNNSDYAKSLRSSGRKVVFDVLDINQPEYIPAINILTKSKIFEKYRYKDNEKPKGKIATLGVIDSMFLEDMQ